ncbi:MAG TPA: 4-alpha-glucanotransferase [Candidatus Fimicola cottocaccae]|nr:4-alpha-glucanotransferase [Candidatus Fimicola cottocaccae]
MRASGILMPISSIPSNYGIGCFDKYAYEFVDKLSKAGQKYWQILPLGPTGYGDSPYQSFSTYAGNPYYISLDELINEGLLTKEECDSVDFGSGNYVDYKKIFDGRFKILRKAYERSNIAENDDFNKFKYINGYWLNDYALYMAVKDFFAGKEWTKWPEDIRLRYGYALDYYRRELYFDIEFYEFMQYKFWNQWYKLKSYANEKGIKIIGDIPIYVAFDSADTWANPNLFQLDNENKPVAVAGCPPDGFSATGQLWGNPLYDWNYHRNTGYEWWVKRIEYCYYAYDVVRIDHFRGFDEYYSIPYGSTTAIDGHWEKGPGMELFNTINYRLGHKEIIAEDLGYLTDSVRQLVKDSTYPGMKVFEFAFDSRDSSSANDYLPHNYTDNCIVYTGTHDNETLMGWFKSIKPEEKNMLLKYIHSKSEKDSDILDDCICAVMGSVAKTCIIPIQDWLSLDNSARINTPSTLGNNWKWRLDRNQFTEELSNKILDITRIYGR